MHLEEKWIEFAYIVSIKHIINLDDHIKFLDKLFSWMILFKLFQLVKALI